MTPSSHLSSSNNSLTAPTPTASQPPVLASNNSNTLKAADGNTSKENDKSNTLKASENRTGSSEDVVSTIVSTSTTQTVCARQNISSESSHPRHPVAVLHH